MFITMHLMPHSFEFITYLLIPECLQVLVTLGPPCLLYLLVVQEALFHQEGQEDPTNQYYIYAQDSQCVIKARLAQFCLQRCSDV